MFKYGSHVTQCDDPLWVTKNVKLPFHISKKCKDFLSLHIQTRIYHIGSQQTGESNNKTGYLVSLFSQSL